jgi:DNA-binding transcriptional ArsR family regulator
MDLRHVDLPKAALTSFNRLVKRSKQAMSSVRATARKEQHLDAVFHALSDTTRRRMLDRLSRESASVSELAAPFRISLAAISKHLDVLEAAGIVRRERDGRFQRCHLTPKALDDASDFIEHYRAFWQDSLDQLAEYVEENEPVAPRRKNRGRTP